MSLFPHFDIVQLIQAFGHLGVLGIVFAETGIFLGFFFPGDSLLFTAGLLASQGFLNIWVLVPLVIMGAILGDSFGYWLGEKIGPKIFTREDSLFFQKRHIDRTQKFYLKYGAKAVVLARFVPVVRTIAPFLAGVGSMPYSTFVRYNIIGGVVWGGGITMLGYFLGTFVPGVDQYLLPIILVIIVVSFLPIVREIFEERKR
ncbi:MAG: DedA family protein [Minisyncoccota bacterium]